MNIGYACHALAVPESDIKCCTLKNASEERLMSLVGHNLLSLEKMIDYNVCNGIRLFRISSDLIPFGSSLAQELPWLNIYNEKLNEISNKIISSGMRVSMHPGQYTVLNSPENSVVERAVKDLEYHAKVLDALRLGKEHKIILHLGGVYKDKQEAIKRFISNYNKLSHAVKTRIVIENDDKLFNIGDVLETASAVNCPVVFDVLHNAVNPADIRLSDVDWINKCSLTWKRGDGLQKIHYSQQNINKKAGAHSESITIIPFMHFLSQLNENKIETDIMLEVKDKNISAQKCINCTQTRGICALESEWARYKYYILEKSPENYTKIRQLLRNKKTYPALEMYMMIETASGISADAGNIGYNGNSDNSGYNSYTGNAVNAAQHVWGYFKNKATDSEKKRFQIVLQKFASGEVGIQSVKNTLLHFALKYKEDYLLNGYYFYL